MHEHPHGGGLQFPDLVIQGFRGIKDLSISQLGRVTLITGKNNTGKSSILEALSLHTRNAEASAIRDVLASREEYTRRSDEEERSSDPESAFHVSTLFHGFPRLSDDFGPIVISTNGRTHPMELSMKVEWFADERDPDGTRRLVSRQVALFGEPENVAVLVAETEEGRRLHRLESFLRRAHGPPVKARMPCILVSSYGNKGTEMLGPLWDDITLTENEKDVVEALRIIDPRISAISMVGGERYPRARTAIVRAANVSRPIPLRSFGDGLNRLFAMVLSLVNARGGLLLIDEFENGLHYTVQLDAWRMIFRLAQELDVQVFATSHSRDAVETFRRAAVEAPDEGALLRLTRRGDDIIPTVLTESELAIATRDKIEVR